MIGNFVISGAEFKYMVLCNSCNYIQYLLKLLTYDIKYISKQFKKNNLSLKHYKSRDILLWSIYSFYNVYNDEYVSNIISRIKYIHIRNNC